MTMLRSTNLRFLSKSHSMAAPYHHVHPEHLPLDMRNGIVKKAMYKFFDETLVNEVLQQRRSRSTPEAVIDDFMKTDQPEIELKKDEHYQKALRVTINLFKPKQPYKPVAFPDLRYYPWTLNVSAEAPYNWQPLWKAKLAKRYAEGQIPNPSPTFHNLYDQIFTANRLLIHKIKDGDKAFFDSDGTPKPYYWTNLHARAHVVGPDDEDKIRAVFGVPKLLLQAENMFIWPMQADLLNRDPCDSPLLWGCEIMKGGWKRLRNLVNNKTEGKAKAILSADWSQFDRRALHSIIDDVHSAWRSFYDFSCYQPTNYYPDASTNPERLERVWKWMTYNVKHYPILLPDGRLFQWQYNGIASGYQQTQLLDSWVNMIMLLTCLSEAGIDIESKHFFIKVQGDDSICAIPSDILRSYGKQRFLSLIAKIALDRFNAKLSTTKSDIQPDLNGVKVLGYNNSSGIAWRTEVDLLSHLYFPERPQSLSATAGTAVGIALAAQGCSRAVYDVCLDVFEFITKELGREAIINASTLRDLIYQGYSDFNLLTDRSIEGKVFLVERFPQFLGTYMQNYVLEHRDESSRNRMWPTDPERTGGFHFL